ncbi:HPP family protein [Rhodococcus sp. NPDC058514]|uniref:HPP family protein n=1 Tax=unclassified Rhodococcus (in: high G+C Gram-positive bacteria) TaxID=192944 RepID=UPI003666BC65
MSAITTDSVAAPWRSTAFPALTAGAAALMIAAALGAAQEALGWTVFGLPYLASAAVIAMAPTAPLARPGAIVRAYPAAAVAALLITAVAGPSQAAAAVSVVSAVVVMVLLRAPHVPAALCAGVIGLTDPGFGYLVGTLVPAVAIVIAVGSVAGRIVPGFEYPLRG